MFKNVIFDWSGVIKDAADQHFWMVKEMFEKMGVEDVSIEELKKGWEEPYMDFYNKYVPGWTLEDQRKVYVEVINREDYPKANACVGIVELIKKLKEKGILIIVLSSDLPDSIYKEIKQFGLENIFDEIVAGVYGKAEQIQELIEKNKLDIKETVFIGDSNHEVEVGKQEGVKTIAVTWGLCTEDKLKPTNPDYLVHNVKELEEILLK